MAKSPIVFFREDDFPEVKEPWIGKLLPKLNDLARQVTNAMTGRLSVTDNMSGFWWDGIVGYYADSTSKYACAAVDDWIKIIPNAPVTNSTSYPMRYRRDSRGMVYIEGRISNCVAGFVFATLPIGYRVGVYQHFAAADASSGSVGTLQVGADGTLSCNSLFAPTPTNWEWHVSYITLPSVNFGTPATNITNTIKAFPFSFPNEIPQSTIGAILVAKAYDVTNGNTKRIPTALGPVAWDMIGNTVVIGAIGGMVPGRAYAIKLLVLGE